jgi:hypothetical protein
MNPSTCAILQPLAQEIEAFFQYTTPGSYVVSVTFAGQEFDANNLSCLVNNDLCHGFSGVRTSLRRNALLEA